MIEDDDETETASSEDDVPLATVRAATLPARPEGTLPAPPNANPPDTPNSNAASTPTSRRKRRWPNILRRKSSKRASTRPPSSNWSNWSMDSDRECLSAPPLDNPSPAYSLAENLPDVSVHLEQPTLATEQTPVAPRRPSTDPPDAPRKPQAKRRAVHGELYFEQRMQDCPMFPADKKRRRRLTLPYHRKKEPKQPTQPFPPGAIPLRASKRTVIPSYYQRIMAVDWPEQQGEEGVTYICEMVESIFRMSGLLGICLAVDAPPLADRKRRTHVGFINPTSRQVVIPAGTIVGFATPY